MDEIVLVNTIYLRKSLVGGEFVDGFISIGGFFFQTGTVNVYKCRNNANIFII